MQLVKDLTAGCRRRGRDVGGIVVGIRGGQTPRRGFKKNLAAVKVKSEVLKTPKKTTYLKKKA